jgi:hypothetical protein
VTAEAIPHMLIRMRKLMRDDGVLVLRFPNGDSPFGRRTQHGDPTHVTTFRAARSLSERIISMLYFNGTRVALKANHVAVLVKTASYPVQQICALEMLEADTASF